MFLLLISTIIIVSCGPLEVLAADSVAQQEQTQPEGANGFKTVFNLIKNMDILNFAFIGVAMFFGTWWKFGRIKLKQIGELALKAYDFTDDKILTDAERKELITDLLQLIGKPKTPPKLPPRNKRRHNKRHSD